MRAPSSDHAPGRPQRWADADGDIRAFVGGAVDALGGLLGDRLLGVYLHGSLAMGCFYRAKSDLDVVAVVDGRLPAATRERVALALARRSTGRPSLGDLELSVLRAEDAGAPSHPIPFEVHYSSAWTGRIMRGGVDYAADRRDVDLAAHMTVTRARGVALAGLDPPRLLGPVPAGSYVDAIADDLRWVLDGDRILLTPYSGVLNACRVLDVLANGPERVLSKEEAAAGAVDLLPAAFLPLVEQALACYRSARPVPAGQRATDGHAWDAPALLAFRDHVRGQLTDPEARGAF